LKEHMFLSKENHQYKKQEHIAQRFLVRIELLFDRNSPKNHRFQGGHRLCLL
jgi:hypothetical protein